MDSLFRVIAGQEMQAMRIGLSALTLCFCFTSLAMGEELQTAEASGNGFANAQVTWQLRNVHQTSPGQMSRSKRGALNRQYVIEADADAGRQGLFPKAHFRLSMDVFAPAEDMPGQTRGKWYVQGIWALEPDVQAQGEFSAGMLAGTLSGRVQAVLPFDPTVAKKAWQGTVRVPMTRVRADNVGTGVRPMRGGGEVAFNSGDVGSLSVNLKLWPKL
jgi:hypothetical protein